MLAVLFFRWLKPASAAPAPAVETQPPRLYWQPSAVEAWVRQHLSVALREHFPDNPDVGWTVLATESCGPYLVAEVEPSSAKEVGYPGFKFLVSPYFREAPQVVATYCLDDPEKHSFTLLATSADCPPGLPREL